MWDTRSWERRESLAGHRMLVQSLAVSPDGNWLASGSADGTIILWNAVSLQQSSVLYGHGSTVTCLAFSPGGDLLTSGGKDATVRGWDVAGGKMRWVAHVREGMRLNLPVLGGDTREIRDLMFTPDGRRIISLAAMNGMMGGLLHCWDASTGERAIEFAEASNSGGAAIAPDGRHILSVFSDGKVAVIKKANLEVSGPRLLAGSIVPVRSCAISDTGGLIACSSDERTLLVYNATSGQADRSIGLEVPSFFLAFRGRQHFWPMGVAAGRC